MNIKEQAQELLGSSTAPYETTDEVIAAACEMGIECCNVCGWWTDEWGYDKSMCDIVCEECQDEN